MFFSIIVPTFNRVDLLIRTLTTVWQQTYTDFEVIVVDDGSTDRTLEYLYSLGERVRVFAGSNKGPGAARNVGINEACGNYVAFLDSDDLWFPWTLKVFAQIIKKYHFPVI